MCDNVSPPQSLLKEILTSLRNPLWSGVERPFYYCSVRAVLQILSHLVRYPHLERQPLSSDVAQAVKVARRLVVESLPKELMEVFQTLSRGKVV